MRKTLLSAIGCIALVAASCGASIAQTTTTGPSSSQTPYVLPITSGGETISILTTLDKVGGYEMEGTPDGLGAFDNGNGTFTLLANHEFLLTDGGIRAHGSKGSFVSKWIIRKSDLKVLHGEDLIKNVYLWDTTTHSYFLANAAHPSAKAAFGRFCSADLPPVAAFYNAATGKGTKERIFMNGEETNDESRAFAHIVTGPNGGTSYELPYLGKAAWENSVATPHSGNKTVVGLLNDGTDGQVYFYIGNKQRFGNEIEKAGLTGGHPWGVKVTGFAKERTSSSSINPPPAPGTTFTLVDLGDVHNMTGAAFNTLSNTKGITSFSRPEDGAWDPSHPNDFYFNTTDQLDQVADGVGTQVGRSRVWRLRFYDITRPELGGTITAVLDGTEGQNMLDNMAIDHYGHIIDLEDVGNSPHNGKVWQYTIPTDNLKMIAKHDPARFGDIGTPATAPFTVDEETSGVIDVQDILGAGVFLFDDQAHYQIPGAAVEGGQLMALFNPDTYRSAFHRDGGRVVICYHGRTMTIPAAFLGFYTSRGAYVGHCIKDDGDCDRNGDDDGDNDDNGGNARMVGGANITNGTTIYPNPANNLATVSLSLTNDDHVMINIVDVQGKQVLNITKDLPKGQQKIDINTADLVNGIYYVLIRSTDETTNLKLVIAH
jgi:hypothetical protein